MRRRWGAAVYGSNVAPASGSSAQAPRALMSSGLLWLVETAMSLNLLADLSPLVCATRRMSSRALSPFAGLGL